MRNLDKMKAVLDLAREYESKGTDLELAKGVKKTTELLLKKKPETTFEDIITNLVMSAKASYRFMLDSDDIETSVDMFMDMAKSVVVDENAGESLTENEEFILRFMFKTQLVTNMLKKSFDVSVKAVSELWNGRDQMAS